MTSRPLAMRDAMLECIYQKMAEDPRIFFVTADFGSPVLDKIRAEYPTRFANVGIAEQNLINVSAGLAIEGFIVFAYAIAPFITMRCFEQIRVNLALLSEVRSMNVTLIGVGAGYSYVVSGPTHQCYEDLSIMRALPTLSIYSPADHMTAAALFAQCHDKPGLKYVRLDAQVLPVIYEEVQPDMRKGFHVHTQGKQICLLATGYMLHTAIQVAHSLAESGIEPGIIDLFDLSHFDAGQLQAELSQYAGIVTLEEGFRGRGGVDSMMFEFLARRNMSQRMFNIGVECGYRFELGTRSELHEQVGIGQQAVIKSVHQFMRTLNLHPESVTESTNTKEPV